MKNVEQSRPSCRARTLSRVSLVHRWAWALPLAALVLAATLGSASPAHAQRAGPALFLPATPDDNARYAQRVRRPDMGVSRQRPVRVDLPALDDDQKSAAAATLELFDGQSVTFEKGAVERRGAGNFTWHGTLPGHPKGFALITVVDGQVSGTIDLGDASRGARTRYRIETTNDGLTLLEEIDTSAFPDDHPAGADPLAPSSDLTTGQRRASADATSSLAAESVAAAADTAGTIDVMIVYSSQTAAAAGAAIAAQAQQAVDVTNQTYANSGISTRLRLVHVGPANYAESGDFNTDLNRLTSGGDGFMDNVAALRTTYGADLVSLFVENGQYCGLAWIGPNVNYAFSVVNRGCATSNLSFPHELGHNFGARHDTYVDSANTPYAFGHGFVNVAQAWRDVMAYNNACAASGVSCARVPYFSNPNVLYGIPLAPMGSASTADVARVHNQNALTVANFRASSSGGSTCTWSLSSGGASVPATAGSASVGVTTQAGCAWSAASNASWLAAGAGSSGAGTLAYTYVANTGPARNGTLTVGGIAFSVSQASGCTYALGSTSVSVPAAGGTGTTTLSTASACTWTASSSASWLTVTTAGNGSGSAPVGYAVAANTGAARSANLTIGGRTFLVSQAAAATTPPASPAATLAPGSLDFGIVAVGKSASRTASVTNSGGGTLTITSLAMGGANPAEFTAKGCAPGTALAAAGSCTLTITFRPASATARSASLAIGTSAGARTLTLTGAGKQGGGGGGSRRR